MASPPPGLKILQIASSLFDWGGIERYVLYLGEGLRQRGHSVEVVCPPESPLAQRWAGSIPFAARSKRNPLYFFHYRKLFLAHRPDVIHTHFSPDFLMPALAARSLGIPCVMTRHLAVPWRPAKARQMSRLYSAIVPVSEAARVALLESGVPADKLLLAKAGCPALVTSKEPVGPLRVGSFGRLVKEKGTQVLIQAATNCPEVEFKVYGDGPEADSLRREAPANVEFLGQIPDVADAMGACHAIAIPSLWAEAFPFAALEAMSLGKPVIASAVGGLPEQVEDGVTGLLFPAGDADALARAIGGLTPERIAALGTRARERHRQEFTVEAFAGRVEAVLRRVVTAKDRQ
ncbi:MAG: glycosyltransferase family 4 protein [Fimbriimonas sp.]